MQAKTKEDKAPAASLLDRLAHLPLRFGKCKTEAALHAAIVAEAARLLRAQRVLLVLHSNATTPRIAPTGSIAARWGPPRSRLW